MPKGGKKAQIGDKCTICECELTMYNIIRVGFEKRLLARCKTCWLKAHNSNESRTKIGRARSWLKFKHGINYGEYKEMQDRQFNGCAICKQPCKTGRELAVDHNHKTGQIRDLLCHSCNVVLGLVNENEDILINMIDYLKKHSSKVA